MDKVIPSLAMLGVAYMCSQSNAKEEGGKASGRHKLTFYYAPWCGHCKVFFPEWEELKRIVSNNYPEVEMESVNCEEDRAECARAGIRGYPTIIVTRADGTSYGYEGERSVDALESELVDLIEAHNVLSAEDKERAMVAARKEMAEAMRLPRNTLALFVVSDRDPSLMQMIKSWAMLERAMQGPELAFTVVNCETDPEMCDLYHIRDNSIVFQLNDKAALKYSGEMDFPHMMEFMKNVINAME